MTTAAAGALLKRAKDSESAVRATADDGSARNEASNALVRMAGREAGTDRRCEPLAAGLAVVQSTLARDRGREVLARIEKQRQDSARRK